MYSKEWRKVGTGERGFSTLLYENYLKSVHVEHGLDIVYVALESKGKVESREDRICLQNV